MVGSKMLNGVEREAFSAHGSIQLMLAGVIHRGTAESSVEIGAEIDAGSPAILTERNQKV